MFSHQIQLADIYSLMSAAVIWCRHLFPTHSRTFRPNLFPADCHMFPASDGVRVTEDPTHWAKFKPSLPISAHTNLSFLRLYRIVPLYFLNIWPSIHSFIILEFIILGSLRWSIVFALISESVCGFKNINLFKACSKMKFYRVFFFF